MAVFINGIGTISPQPPWSKVNAMVTAREYTGDRLACIEPDYSHYMDVKQLRRMSRIIKMGMACGMDALKEAGLKVPDGIVTGTSFGCLEDTGIFLAKMIENQENALNPTPFIQSTHNTIGSQLALLLQCQGYNQTYTQRAFSFENALVDSIMAIAENEALCLLTGSADEITAYSHQIISRFGVYRQLKSNLDLFESDAKGTINGEGAAYFVLSGRSGQNAVELATVNMLYKPTLRALETGILACIESTQLNIEDIDLVLLGKSGDAAFDSVTNEIANQLFKASTIGRFKHLIGEFPTASAIAMSLACRIIQSQRIPDVVKERDMNRAPKNVLIYNPYFGLYHSLVLLKAC